MKREEIIKSLNNIIHLKTKNESHLGSIRISREFYQKLICDIYDFANAESNYNVVRFIESELKAGK